MIYDVRTYDLKYGAVEQFRENIRARLDKRREYSPLGGYWYTVIGPLSQVVSIWPYKDEDDYLAHHTQFNPVEAWGPDNDAIVLNAQNEIMIPAPFMKPLRERRIGPIYDMRIDTYAPGDIPKTLEAWGKVIDEREKLSPLAGCWHSDIKGFLARGYEEPGIEDDGLNLYQRIGRFIHLWAYKTFEDWTRVRAESHERDYWPPPGRVLPLKSENKIMLPFDFSPMQ